MALIGDTRYDPAPFGYTGTWTGIPHVYNGRPDNLVELNQADIDRTGDPRLLARSSVVSGLVLCGRDDEAMALAVDLVTAAEATSNPASLTGALLVFGMVFRYDDPPRAMHTFRRAAAVARDSGNRIHENYSASYLAVLEAEHGNPHVAMDLLTQAIRGYHDAGDIVDGRSPLARLAAFLARTGCHEPAAVIAGYATSPLSQTTVPELAAVAEHLRAALGPDRQTALTDQGKAMAPNDAVRYALEQIEAARATL